VTRGTLILLLGTLGFVAANFVGRVLLIRTLSKTEFDEFYIALTVAGLLSAIGQIGLPSAVARSIPFAGTDAERRGIIRAGFMVAVPIGLAAGALLFILSIPISQRFDSPVLGLTLEYFGVAVATSIISSQVAAVFQGFEDVRPNAIFNQILNPIMFITFLVTIGGAGPWGAPFGYTGAVLAFVLANVLSLTGLVLFYQFRHTRYLAPGPVHPEAASRLLRFAGPLFLIGVFSYVSGTLDTLVLGYFHNNQAGDYGAALSLARLTVVGLGALGYILLPVVTRFARDDDGPSARVVYATATKWMILTSLPLFLVFLFYPGASLAFVYKASYAQSTLPLQILVTGAFVGTLIGPASAAQISFGQTRALLYNAAVALVADAGLSYLLIPAYGSTGAAIAWSSAAAILPILSVSELAWTKHIHPFLLPYLVAVLGTGIPAALLLWLVPFSPKFWALPVLVLLIALAFVAVVIFTRSIDRGDRLLLDAVERILGRKVPGVRWIARRFPPRS
jgi:O-antigen/teichoic acid export membrane protein